MKKSAIVAWCIGLTLMASAQAQVIVTEAWIRATVAQAKAGGASMRLTSAQDARLLEVRSRVAGSIQIHQMEMDGQMMKMHVVPSLELPAGKTIDLAPGGYHLMLLDLKQQLKQGDNVPMTLVVQNKNKEMLEINIEVPVKALGYVKQSDAMSHDGILK